MAVFIRGHPDNKPLNAKEVRPDQVASFYHILVETWKPPTEVWALTFGSKILGLAAAGSGIYGNMYFRRKLRLKNYGLLSTYLPNIMLPFLIVNLTHATVNFQIKTLKSLIDLCSLMTFFFQFQHSVGDQRYICRSVWLFVVQRNQSSCYTACTWIGTTITYGASFSVHVFNKTFHLSFTIANTKSQRIFQSCSTIVSTIESANVYKCRFASATRILHYAHGGKSLFLYAKGNGKTRS